MMNKTPPSEEAPKGVSAQVTELEEIIFSKYDSVYESFLDVARKGIKVLDDLKLPQKTISAIEDVSSKIKLPSVEIRGIFEITNTKPDGVEIIKKILVEPMKKDKESNIEITYVGAPKYRITVSAPDFKSAEKTLKPIISDIQESVEKQKGTFNFIREDSKKTRVG